MGRSFLGEEDLERSLKCWGMPGTAGTLLVLGARCRGPPGPLISGVLYERLLCCCAALFCVAMAGREGPRGFLPFICGPGEAPSRDGARGMVGYGEFSSHREGCGVPDFDHGYPENIPLVVLVLDDAGDASIGEK